MCDGDLVVEITGAVQAMVGYIKKDASDDYGNICNDEYC
jgi:hypothetical protein